MTFYFSFTLFETFRGLDQRCPIIGGTKTRSLGIFGDIYNIDTLTMPEQDLPIQGSVFLWPTIQRRTQQTFDYTLWL